MQTQLAPFLCRQTRGVFMQSEMNWNFSLYPPKKSFKLSCLFSRFCPLLPYLELALPIFVWPSAASNFLTFFLLTFLLLLIYIFWVFFWSTCQIRFVLKDKKNRCFYLFAEKKVWPFQSCCLWCNSSPYKKCLTKNKKVFLTPNTLKLLKNNTKLNI